LNLSDSLCPKATEQFISNIKNPKIFTISN
jgi:hypothetical protein